MAEFTAELTDHPDIGSDVWCVDGPMGSVCAMDGPADENEEAAKLVARLLNIHHAGQSHNSGGDLNYGLTENEVAAAKAMNTLLAENTAFLATLARLFAKVTPRPPEYLWWTVPADQMRLLHSLAGEPPFGPLVGNNAES